MAIEVTIPRLGWSMDEGTFVEWLKADGDFVQAGEAVFALESEKALQEVESLDSGILRILPDAPQENETVTVGTLVAYLVEEGESIPLRTSATQEPVTEFPAQLSPSANRDRTPNTNPDSESEGRRHAISPRAARLAKQLGVDTTLLLGSGKTGRICEQDVHAAVAGVANAPVRSDQPPTGRLRQVIAARMMHSVKNTAPVTLTSRIDATNLVALRGQFKSAGLKFVPSYQDILAKLVALTLRTNMELSYQWKDGQIVEPEGIHIGLAVDTDAGLLVPVIRNCDRLSLVELARHSAQQIERARAGKCLADELTGGTFTITNLGALGIDAFTPIINLPETAVLGLGAIRREAVVLDDDQIVPRHQMTVSLTFDHRVTDGAPAARFLQTLISNVEESINFDEN